VDKTNFQYWLKLLAPWHWPMWIGMGLLWLISCLPHPAGIALGKGIGSAFYHVLPIRKNILDTNLRICFPEWSSQKREQVMKAHYQSMGIGLFELGRSWFCSNKTLEGLADFEGVEELERLRKSGRSIILLGGHFTNIELVGRLLIENHIRFGILYRKPNNPVVAHFMTHLRETRTSPVVHFDDIQNYIRNLRKGTHFWYAPDQARTFKYATLAPFFGEPAITNAATGRIARMGKASILPFFAVRTPEGSYKVTLGPEWKLTGDETPEEEATALNKLFEQKIRMAPEQYLWLHKRFKNRGKDFPDVYA
jgi:KDO2-lipid IV(A) lauroyltransferase